MSKNINRKQNLNGQENSTQELNVSGKSYLIIENPKQSQSKKFFSTRIRFRRVLVFSQILFSVLFPILLIVNFFIEEFSNFWKKGRYAIAFACGGALLGSLSGKTFIALLGAMIGGIYGLKFQEVIKSDLNNNLTMRVIFSKRLFKQGEYMIAFASGGALLGGVIGQFPGSITGALIGTIVSLFSLEKVV